MPSQVIPCKDISITGGFWREMQTRNRDVTVPAVRARFLETGRFAALDFSKPWDEGQKPHIFWDSDIAKWLEAAAYILQKEHDPQLEQAVEEAVSLIEKNQGEDGYFNSCFMRAEPEKRWKLKQAPPHSAKRKLFRYSIIAIRIKPKVFFIRWR